MDAALDHGDGNATEDEDNGEEMSDLSSVRSCQSPTNVEAQQSAAQANLKAVGAQGIAMHADILQATIANSLQQQRHCSQ